MARAGDDAGSAGAAKAAAALACVVDDLSDREAAVGLAAEALLAGIALDEVEAKLREGGWDAQATQDLVEEARRLTRRQRGAFTRADVAGTLGRAYRRGWWNAWLAGYPALGSAWRLLHSLTGLLALRRLLRRRKPGA